MRFISCGAWFFSTLIGIGADPATDLPQQPIRISNHKNIAFDPSFDAYVEDLLQEFHVPGLSVAIIDNGKIISKGYGFAQLPDVHATADTQYFAGSTTKAFTAAAAALLVHSDNYPDVKWTSPISELIRQDFVLEDAYATFHTTIEDALSHRSGLPGHDFMYGQPGDIPSKVVQRMRYLPMTAEPRTKWQYCNIMFGVITDLIETITGQQLETILSENFWKPLGMSSTGFTIPFSKRLARGYYWDPTTTEDSVVSKQGRYVPDPYVDISPISGAGATISTVNDYALWVKALLDAADYDIPQNKSSPVTRRIYRDLATPRSIIMEFLEGLWSSELGLPPLYGLGWILSEVLGEKMLAHAGGLTGFGTELFMIPGKKFGVVTMGNTAGTSNEVGSLVASWLLQKLFDVTDTKTRSFSEVENSLLKIRKANSLATGRRETLSKRHTLTPQKKSLPLHFSMNDFAGSYFHPAYGTVNVTVPVSQFTSSRSNNILEVLINHAWPIKLKFVHDSGTAFSVAVFLPHGLGDIETGEDIVWEEVANVDAVFELGIDGEEVELMGMEIESEMIDMAEKKGEKYWREGMIWFEKVRE